MQLQFPTGRKENAQLLVVRGCPVEVDLDHKLLPTMEAMAKQARKAHKSEGSIGVTAEEVIGK